jgi:hypothetical protein
VAGLGMLHHRKRRLSVDCHGVKGFGVFVLGRGGREVAGRLGT